MNIFSQIFQFFARPVENTTTTASTDSQTDPSSETQPTIFIHLLPRNRSIPREEQLEATQNVINRIFESIEPQIRERENTTTTASTNNAQTDPNSEALRRTFTHLENGQASLPEPLRSQIRNVHIINVDTDSAELLLPNILSTFVDELMEIIPTEPQIGAREEELATILAEKIKDAAMFLHKNNVYTKEEIEDLLTAFLPILNIAIFNIIKEHFLLKNDTLHFQKTPENTTSSSSLLLTHENSPLLFPHKNLLIQALSSIKDIPEDGEEKLKFHLCSDPKRFREEKIELPEITARETELLKTIAALRTNYIEKKVMKTNSQALFKSFELDAK